jgi:hypothetical protein
MAASTDQPSKFDEAARTLHIPILRSAVIEGIRSPSTVVIPSVGPWVFQGAKPGDQRSVRR